MSIETMAIVLHHSRAAGTAKLVLLGIANHDGDGGAWPAVATLAKYANVSRRNVQKALEQLETTGELRRHLGKGGDHSTADYHRPNLYEVAVRCPETCDRSKNHRTRTSLNIPEFDPVSLTTPPVESDVTPVSHATPKPSLNSTMETKTPNSSNRARANATIRCKRGHLIVGMSGGGVPVCEFGCSDIEPLVTT